MSIRPSSSPTRTATDVREKTIAAIERFYKPGPRSPEIISRKARFDALNRIVQSHGGWIVSIPGAAEIVFEVVPVGTTTALFDELRDIGFKPVPADPPEGERILTAAIVERFGRGPDGELQRLTEGSTMAFAEIRRHAGIVCVARWRFPLS